MSKNSLRRKKDFDRVFEAGQSFYCPILAIKSKKNDLEFNRFGIIISLKVSKKAVIRNKIRRRIREILKNNIVKNKENRDFVIIVSKNIIDKDFQEIKENILKILEKIK